MESQLVIFKLSNYQLNLPAISSTTALSVLRENNKKIKKPAIDINVGEIISGKGLVVGKYVYSLTESKEAIPGRTEAVEEYI